MMEAVSTSETSVNFYETTRRNIPEDSHLHIRRRENLKYHRDKDYIPEDSHLHTRRRESLKSHRVSDYPD
jgi:hypothetical protein